MWSIFMAQLAKDRRNPLVLLLFIAASIAMTLLFAGSGQGPSVIILFSEEENAEEIEDKWLKLLNQEGAFFEFKRMDSEAAREQVQTGQSSVAIRLMERDYRLIAAFDSPTIQQVDQYVRKVFTQQLQIEALSDSGHADAKELKESVSAYMENAPFRMAKQDAGGDEVSSHNMGVQLLFAFTLMLAMFTAGFKINGVTQDKVSGIWSRLILSPVSKTRMYAGYLSYSFCITFFQIAVVLFIFQYVLNYDLGDRFGLIIGISAVFTFSIISLAMLITGFVSKPEQFYSIYPSAIPIIPLISGAYMMPGTMDHPILTFIADLFPMSHAIESLMKVVNDGAGLAEVALPVSIMLLIGVVYMGIGINLVERKAVHNK